MRQGYAREKLIYSEVWVYVPHTCLRRKDNKLKCVEYLASLVNTQQHQ